MSTERKKRKSKWDQTTPEGVAKTSGSSHDASVSAAAAAARLNAKLEAEGKLQRPMLSSVAQNTSLLSSKSIAQAVAAGDSTVAIAGMIPALTGMEGVSPVEIEINDSEARGTLTKGPVLNDINKQTGAYISVRGRYMTLEEKANCSPTDQPLYLHIQGPNISFINAAVQKVKSIMREADNPNDPPTPSLLSSVILPPGQSIVSPMGAAGHHYLQDKVYVGIADAPEDFKLLEKLQGPGGTFLGHIASTTGAKVFLRGKGSGYLEPTSGRESFEALYVYLSHPKPEGLAAAKKLSENLTEHVKQEYTSYQQSKLYGSNQPLYQPPMGNPYYQVPTYNQGPPAPVPQGYAPHPHIMPHPQQQITHPVPLPHAPPTEMGMGPIRPLSQPPIVNGGDFYNGSGYVAPPPNHLPGPPPPPNHLGYMGGPPPPPPHMIHAGGGTPPPPVPVPIPNYPLPPPMVGPEKPPYLAEVNSEPVYTNGPPLPLLHEVPPPPHSMSLAPPTSVPSNTTDTNIGNLAYHQLPRNKPMLANMSAASAQKRKFTEKTVTTSTPVEDKVTSVSLSSPAAPLEAKPSPSTQSKSNTTVTPAIPSVKKFTESPIVTTSSSTPPTAAAAVSDHTNNRSINKSITSSKESVDCTLMPPPSFNPRGSSSMTPPTKPLLPHKRLSNNSPKGASSTAKKPKTLSLVSYGEDSSDSDNDN